MARFQSELQSAPADCARQTVPQLDTSKLSQAFVLEAPRNPAGEALIVSSQDTIAERMIVLATDGKGCLHIDEVGRLYDFEKRSINSVLANVQLPADVAGKPIVAIVEDRKTIRPWIKIATQSQFEGDNTKVWTSLGAYTGMVAIFLLVGIGMAWWHRSSLGLAYVVYVATIQFYQLQALGLGFSSFPFWPGPEAFPLMQALAVAAVVGGISTAVVAFLQPQGWARTVLIWGMTTICVVYVSSVWISFSYRIASAMLMVAAITVFALLVQRLRSGDISVRWFAAGFATTMVGGGIQASSIIFGGAGFSALATVAFPIATLFEAALWMIALTTRIRADRLAMERQLYLDATHDSLTGLYNRAFLYQRIVEQLLVAKRDPDHKSGLLFIDLDRFKFINDTMGHRMGDKVLTEVAQILKQAGMGTQVIGRVGGDEFAILLDTKAHWSSAVGIATSLMTRFEEPLIIGRRSINVSASIGIVAITADYDQPDEIMRDADTALYSAKSKGGRRHENFNATMRDETQERLRIEMELPRALDKGQFHMHFHPIVEISDSMPAGFEALLRWKHPEKGVLTPKTFLPIAEDTGFIRNLGSFVIDRTFEQIHQWQEEGVWKHGLFMSINVSSQHLVDEDLIRDLNTAFDKYPVDPSSIRIELTEQALKDDLDLARRVLPRVRDMNVMLSLDNFGTGDSSLSCLHEFLFDVVKVDKSTTDGVAHQDRAQQLMNAVLAISGDLGFLVVAEGIERPNQVNVLKALGCTYAQGFHFAHPMPAEEVAEWLNLWRMTNKSPGGKGDGYPVH